MFLAIGGCIATLTQTMSIGSPSLYAAFSDKPKLFDEALCRYEMTVGSLHFTRLGSAPDIGSGVRALIEDAVGCWTTRTDEKGVRDLERCDPCCEGPRRDRTKPSPTS